MPGVTRDRRHFVAEFAGSEFEVVDTGGLEPGARGLDARVSEQAQLAAETADVIILVVDALAGIGQDDLVVADLLRKADKPVVVAANKVDDPADEPLTPAFYRLGLGEPVPVSALHGRNSGDFLQVVVDALPEVEARPEDAWGAAAIIGRPNVGKSSILNALVGQSRALVDAAPGTTRDPVDAVLPIDDRRVVKLVDTAGMRREVRINDPIEYFSSLRSRRTLTRVDAAVLVVDASEGITGHDQRLAEEVVDQGRACVVALNKWDLAPRDDQDRRRLEDAIVHKLRFLQWATVVRTSARTGRGVDKLGPALAEAIESHRRRLPTSLVNRVVREAQEQRPHPRAAGRARRLFYAVQARTSPPTVVAFANGSLDPSYVRYIENRLRRIEPFRGSPLRIEVRLRSRPER